MLRTRLYADPSNRFLHDVVLASCEAYAEKTAIFDAAANRRLTYSEYGEIVHALAAGFVARGVKPGEVIAIYLPTSWEFCAAYHAATLAGAIPTLLNPTYREREVNHQMESSGAAFLVTDGQMLSNVRLSHLPELRRIISVRSDVAGADSFASVLKQPMTSHPHPAAPAHEALAALPYSSGTTGMPKGVMLSHYNLVANVFQLLGPGGMSLTSEDTVLCFLPLYHIYGLNVVLNPVLTLGATLVLLPRFNLQQVQQLIVDESITMMPTVPPALLALAAAAESGDFPTDHRVRWVKSGAAPLAPDLARRFTETTGILICQGYGMTEASPVTHLGYLEPELYKATSIGQPMCQTECRIVDDNGEDLEADAPGELVMRGPQFMLGYWREPRATEAVLRDGWYWSGDVVTRDPDDFYFVVDRRKELIKYKGFSIAPAEVEAVLLECPAVRDCGVVGCKDDACGEIPVAFVVARDDVAAAQCSETAIAGFVAERLTHYKVPRRIQFVEAIPKTASGKILRRELRKMV